MRSKQEKLEWLQYIALGRVGVLFAQDLAAEVQRLVVERPRLGVFALVV